MSYEPTWKEHSDKVFTSHDPHEQFKALEALDETRTKEMAMSKKARDWEISRKASAAKEKPQWVKKKRAEETAELDSFITDLKKGGKLDAPITPMPGYLLVKPDTQKEQTESGLFLAMAEDIEPTTGTIVAVGEQLVMAKNVLNCPVKIGDKVLFKKFAGMSLLVAGESCRLMQFTDMLARIDD